MYMNFSQEGALMYFTETPHLQRIEQMMISIPYHIPRSSFFRCNGQNYHDQITTKLAMQILLDSFGSRKLEKRMKGIDMKPQFTSKQHYDRFTGFLKSMTLSPAHCSRNYVAAVFLLSSNSNLWEKAKPHINRNAVDFDKIKLGSVTTTIYTIFKAAKEVYTDRAEISVSEFCDCLLINDRTISNIFTAMLIENHGYRIVDTSMFEKKAKAV